MPSPFEILGVPARFDLDEDDLHRRFIALSSQTHPDRFTDSLDQADAAERAATVNQAYRVLRDPESRADALLVLLGGPDKSSDKSLPPDLLADMMDVREKMEEAIAQRDEAAIGGLRAWAGRTREEHLKRIAESFGRGGPAALREIRVELNALRYIERMIEQLPGSTTL